MLGGSFRKRAFELKGDARVIVEAQMARAGISEEDVWTWHRMAYDL